MSNPLKIAARVWLVILNTFLVAISVGLIAVGSFLDVLNRNGSFNNLEGMDSVTGIIGNVSIAIIAIGCFLALTSLIGCCGTLFRVNSFLSVYVALLFLNVLGVIGSGVFTIYRMVQEQNGWKGVTVQVWASAPERTQDFLQVLYKCCGFIKGDTLAYTGHSFLYENSTTKVGDIGLNQCTPGANPPPSTYDGCQNAGNNFWSTLVIRAAITFSVLFLVLAITIPAANRARKSPKQYGKIVTEPSIIQGQGPYQKF